MALSGIQIFKMLPKKNCKECGCPTCMAFSMKVAQGALKIEQCPHVSAEALEALSEATAPPMKTIKVGTGEGEYTLGGETVLYRHEKTYVNKTRYAVSLCSCMDDATIDAKIAAIPAVDYERIGERMRVEMIYVNYGAEAGADKYLELVKKAVATGKTLVLGCDDVEVAKAALEIAKAGKPILNGANASNYEAMNALAKEADVVLGVSGANLDEIYDTVAALEKAGNKNLILDVGKPGNRCNRRFHQRSLCKRCTDSSRSTERSGQNFRLPDNRKYIQTGSKRQIHAGSTGFSVHHEIRFYRSC